MVRYGKNTKLGSEQVLAKAKLYLGPDGLGLEPQEAGRACARWTGAGGFVYVSTCEGDKGTEVTLEAREWEAHAKEFVAKL
jgi:hypothetical protein